MKLTERLSPLKLSLMMILKMMSLRVMTMIMRELM